MIYMKASKTEMEICKKILKDAFKNYEFFNIYACENQEIFFNSIMDIWIKNCFKHGTVLVAKDNDKITSAACLKAPNDDKIEIVDFSHIESNKLISICGMENVKKFINMCEISDKACNNLPNPKWHLVFLAVSNEYQGKGIGSKMIKECIIPYIKREGGRLLTFNTNTEINRSFYKKNGFEEFDEEMLRINNKEIGNWSYKMQIQ